MAKSLSRFVIAYVAFNEIQTAPHVRRELGRGVAPVVNFSRIHAARPTGEWVNA